MLKVKDYLLLREIMDYLSDRRSEEEYDNGGFTNNHIELLKKFVSGLKDIIEKLEND